MTELRWKVYLSGEIHSGWREQVKKGVDEAKLPIVLLAPVTDHSDSDECGAEILGREESKFWNDHKGAKLNTIRNRKLISEADVVVVRFGEKYKQWNSAYDAGYATALGKSVIVLHPTEFGHALKEIDASALAVTETIDQVIEILKYITRQ